MTDTPKSRTTGLSPKEQKLQAMREKLANQKSGNKHTPNASLAAAKANTVGARKTNFQRKAT